MACQVNIMSYYNLDIETFDKCENNYDVLFGQFYELPHNYTQDTQTFGPIEQTIFERQS